MLHGNEVSGWQVLQKFLARYRDDFKKLPRSVLLLIGNVRACTHAKRYLEGQLDYNRIWQSGDRPEHVLAQAILEKIASLGPYFASIDIHNNTGNNPYYACVNDLNLPELKLARLFSQDVVYFTRPKGVHAMAMAKFAPSVTLELGQPGDSKGVEWALRFIDRVMTLSSLSDVDRSVLDELNVLHSRMVIKAMKEIPLGFDPADESRLLLNPELEKHNFREVPQNCVWALNVHQWPCLELRDGKGVNRIDDLFEKSNERMITKKPFIPAMLTTNLEVIEQDCLGYVMEKIDLSRVVTKKDKEMIEQSGPGIPGERDS